MAPSCLGVVDFIPRCCCCSSSAAKSKEGGTGRVTLCLNAFREGAVGCHAG